ncbi:MAG: zinc-ribbon domain-containing protein [Salinivenus sp.]
MADSSDSCPSCGAQVPADADQCTLCGTPVDEEDPPPDSSSAEDVEAEADAPGASPASDSSDPSDAGTPDRVFCTQCGFENPGGANYCSRCGTELQDLSGAGPSPGTTPVSADLPRGETESTEDPATEAPAPDAPEAENDDGRQAVGSQVVWMVGLGIVVVLGFFFATRWSQQYQWSGQEGNASPAATAEERPAAQGGGASPSASGGGAGPQGTTDAPDTDLGTLVDELGGPVDGPVADKIDSLRAVADEASGDRRRQARAELVRMYIGAGTPGRAALVQGRLAEATGTVDDQRRAADLLYRWMRQVEQEGDRARVADVAGHVAAAYETVAEQRPQDLDARTRMGEAYLLTNNPMEGIRTINDVLGEDSTFVPARFQKGLALLQINRLDQAIEQFRRVKEYADPQQPFYKQAERAIEIIEKRRSSAAADTTASAP